jgi:DNA polymerase
MKGFDATPELQQRLDTMTSSSKLEFLRDCLGDCTRCKLHTKRKNIVFGDGDPNADLVFVGEGPGFNEDKRGIPFVGKAGNLLDRMIVAMGIERQDVYIANVVKCRPPNNRDPEPDEIAKCAPFLYKQLETVNPKVIITLGRFASQCLLDTKRPMRAMRGRWQEWRGIQVMPTYHPAYLLRNPAGKRDAWSDLQMVMKELGL